MVSLRPYLNLNVQATTLGLRAGILSAIFSIIFVVHYQQNLNFMLAVIGVFNATLLEASALQISPQPSAIDHLKHGIFMSIVGGIMVALGSIAAHHPALLSLGMLLIALPVGLSCGSGALTVSAILFTANLFIIGSGLPAPAQHAFLYGVYFFVGCLLLVLTGYLQRVILKPRANLQSDTTATPRQIFTLNTKNLKFALKLAIAVCAANAIAGYIEFPQQYCAPMTALLILCLDHQSSIKKINHRLFGTLIGSILAAGLILLVQNKLILAALMLPIMFFIAVSLAKHYDTYVFFDSDDYYNI